MLVFLQFAVSISWRHVSNSSLILKGQLIYKELRVQLGWLAYFPVCMWHRAVQLNQLFQSFLPAAIQVRNKRLLTWWQSFHSRPTKKEVLCAVAIDGVTRQLPSSSSFNTVLLEPDCWMWQRNRLWKHHWPHCWFTRVFFLLMVVC